MDGHINRETYSKFWHFNNISKNAQNKQKIRMNILKLKKQNVNVK